MASARDGCPSSHLARRDSPARPPRDGNSRLRPTGPRHLEEPPGRPAPQCLLVISRVTCVSCSPVHPPFNIQVTESTFTRILSFDMKENGEEAGNMVRMGCGLFLQPCR
ncbi:hypothetical protein J1605_000672 [Eschrichtius robustus]|uniref:Uncharacterized protein n=1 Tax=Eschrichtius robustus TaxID=9764 RepID=A0AB34GM59_ESCRO|nr:hypothetical protein J1605_000672 [Eschrichtius robustus]